MKIIECITNEDLELAAEIVKNHIKYGRENKIIDCALQQYPLNNNISIISMKICLIDLTNGTNLMRNLGTEGGLYDLASKITQINFDERVSNGDISLVNELARWTKEKFNKNLFSFIIKYCLYHNVHCYKKDDYVIYDSVLAENINKYISEEEFRNITKKNLYKNSIKNYRDNFQYEEYKKIIDYIIKKNNITVDKPRRKIDWFIWNTNRETKND